MSLPIILCEMLTESDFRGFSTYAKRLWSIQLKTSTALVSYRPRVLHLYH